MAAYFKSQQKANEEFPEDPWSWDISHNIATAALTFHAGKTQHRQRNTPNNIVWWSSSDSYNPVLQVQFSLSLQFEVNGTHIPTESKIMHMKMEVITSHECNSPGSQKASFQVGVLAHSLLTQPLSYTLCCSLSSFSCPQPAPQHSSLLKCGRKPALNTKIVSKYKHILKENKQQMCFLLVSIDPYRPYSCTSGIYSLKPP